MTGRARQQTLWRKKPIVCAILCTCIMEFSLPAGNEQLLNQPYMLFGRLLRDHAEEEELHAYALR
jgi:hypothetical protein